MSIGQKQIGTAPPEYQSDRAGFAVFGDDQIAAAHIEADGLAFNFAHVGDDRPLA
jgi:hypothetical protein